jgi:hypothetical protein
MTRYEGLKGNTNAQKKHPRNSQLNCRFNSDILKRVRDKVLTPQGISMADYIEKLILADLDGLDSKSRQS